MINTTFEELGVPTHHPSRSVWMSARKFYFSGVPSGSLAKVEGKTFKFISISASGEVRLHCPYSNRIRSFPMNKVYILTESARALTLQEKKRWIRKNYSVKKIRKIKGEGYNKTIFERVTNPNNNKLAFKKVVSPYDVYKKYIIIELVDGAMYSVEL